MSKQFKIDLAARITTALDTVGTVTSIDDYCCGSCAFAGLEKLPAGTHYVHANEQRWEDVHPGATVWFGHGLAGEDYDPDAHVAATRRAVQALVDAGLHAGWDGDLGRNIEVQV